MTRARSSQRKPASEFAIAIARAFGGAMFFALPLFMTMGRLSQQDGGRFCAVLRDITHWKRTEAELVKAKQSAEAASTQKRSMP